MPAIETLTSSLRRAEDGVWYASTSEPISYPEQGHERCLGIEERSFWFRHRNDCILAAVRSHPPPAPGTFFDVGGGNGVVSMALAEAGYDVVLVEPGRDGARNARRRGLDTVVCTTLEGCGFAPASLPACGLFDVLEHVDDDLGFLRSLRSLLLPRGKLYTTVPAHSFLWSEQDKLAGHFRRYSSRGLKATLEAAGFEVSFATYIFRFLPFALFLSRVVPYRLGFAEQAIVARTVEREHTVSSPLSSRLLPALLASEVKNVGQGRPMSFGASCLVVATSP